VGKRKWEERGQKREEEERERRGGCPNSNTPPPLSPLLATSLSAISLLALPTDTSSQCLLTG